jgi:hypothetical protein
MSGVDWGTVPAWSSSILTSGSLALGFYILLRDRRKEDREEASLVTCWLEGSGDGRMVHVLNASPRPIPYAALSGRFFGREGQWVARTDPPVVRPGQELRLQLSEMLKGHRRHVVAELRDPETFQFTDADGQRWKRDLWTSSLTRDRTPLRIRFGEWYGYRRQHWRGPRLSRLKRGRKTK